MIAMSRTVPSDWIMRASKNRRTGNISDHRANIVLQNKRHMPASAGQCASRLAIAGKRQRSGIEQYIYRTVSGDNCKPSGQVIMRDCLVVLPSTVLTDIVVLSCDGRHACTSGKTLSRAHAHPAVEEMPKCCAAANASARASEEVGHLKNMFIMARSVLAGLCLIGGYSRQQGDGNNRERRT